MIISNAIKRNSGNYNHDYAHSFFNLSGIFPEQDWQYTNYEPRENI